MWHCLIEEKPRKEKDYAVLCCFFQDGKCKWYVTTRKWVNDDQGGRFIDNGFTNIVYWTDFPEFRSETNFEKPF